MSADSAARRKMGPCGRRLCRVLQGDDDLAVARCLSRQLPVALEAPARAHGWHDEAEASGVVARIEQPDSVGLPRLSALRRQIRGAHGQQPASAFGRQLDMAARARRPAPAFWTGTRGAVAAESLVRCLPAARRACAPVAGRAPDWVGCSTAITASRSTRSPARRSRRGAWRAWPCGSGVRTRATAGGSAAAAPAVSSAGGATVGTGAAIATSTPWEPGAADPAAAGPRGSISSPGGRRPFARVLGQRRRDQIVERTEAPQTRSDTSRRRRRRDDRSARRPVSER